MPANHGMKVGMPSVGEPVSSTHYAVRGTKAGWAQISISYKLASDYWYTAVLFGDANGDGQVNTGDVTKMERIILGLEPPSPGADAADIPVAEAV